jgi:hypothetical protein
MDNDHNIHTSPWVGFSSYLKNFLSKFAKLLSSLKLSMLPSSKMSTQLWVLSPSKTISIKGLWNRYKEMEEFYKDLELKLLNLEEKAARDAHA